MAGGGVHFAGGAALRLTRLEGLRAGQQAQPGGRVRGHGHSSAPGPVDLVLAGREPAEAGVFGVTDRVLDAGVGGRHRPEDLVLMA